MLFQSVHWLNYINYIAIILPDISSFQSVMFTDIQSPGTIPAISAYFSSATLSTTSCYYTSFFSLTQIYKCWQHQLFHNSIPYHIFQVITPTNYTAKAPTLSNSLNLSMILWLPGHFNRCISYFELWYDLSTLDVHISYINYFM